MVRHHRRTLRRIFANAAAHLIDRAVNALAEGTFTDGTAAEIGAEARALIASVG